MTVAVLKLAAWHFHWLSALRFGAPAALMQFNTALGFILSALALLNFGGVARRRQLILPSLVLALGVATGFEHLTGRSLGIDDLFFRPYIDDHFSPGGRMVASSALAFSCTGLALLAWQSRIPPRIRFVLGSVLATAVGILALMNLAGYADSAGVGFGWHGLIGMAVATAWLFVILSLGLAAMVWHGYLTAEAQLKMIAVPFVALLLGLTATLVIIQGLYVSRATTEAAAVERDAVDVARVVQLESGRDLKLFGRLQARWQGGMPSAIWEKDTQDVLRDNHTIFAAALFSPDFKVVRNLTAADTGLLQEAVTRHTQALRLLNPNERFLVAGEGENRHLLLFMLPLWRTSVFNGEVAIAYDIQSLLNNVASAGWSRPARISIIGGQGTLAVYPPSAAADPSAITRETGLDFGRDHWTIRVSEAVDGGGAQGVILLTLLIGTTLSMALAIALYQQGRLRDGSAVLRATATRLEAREEELTRLNKELEQFAYVASHDLKAPLRSIDNLAQWMIEDMADLATPAIRQQGDMLRGRVARLEKLLDDILAYSRTGRIMEDSGDIDIWQLVNDIAIDLPRGFEVRTETYLPVVHSPRTPLHQVFQNLFLNAIKHHDRQTGIITVTAIERGDFYEFAVSDDGPGIPDEFKEKVFDMFKTLKPRDKVEGSGLGLSIVKKLVGWQKGRVWIENNSERGSSVHFLWPRRSIAA